jgi:hypothetical protein
MSIKEDVNVSTELLTVKATDNDDGVNAVIRFSLLDVDTGASSEDFQIDADSGVVSVKQELNRDDEPAAKVYATGPHYLQPPHMFFHSCLDACYWVFSTTPGSMTLPLSLSLSTFSYP